MKNIKLVLILLLVIGTYSCTDDLDVVPEDDDITTTANGLVTADDYRRYLAGIYANLAQPGTEGATESTLAGIDGGTSTFSRVLWYMQTLTTDEAIWSYENDEGVAALQRNIWTDTNVFMLGMFSRMGQTLAFCNELRRQSEGLTDTDVAGISTMRAEARFIRALNYYYYLDLFNKAPQVDESTPVNASFKPPQIEGQALFDYIESELLAVIDELPAAGSNEYGRADQGAARMVLAKLYLNAEVYVGANRYTDCLTQLNAVIGSGAYTLNDIYGNNFNADNDINYTFNSTNGQSPEIIFPIISDGEAVQNFGVTTIIINGEVGSVEGNGVPTWGVEGFGGALRLKSQISQILLSTSAGDRNTLFTSGRPIQVTNIADQSTGYTHRKFTNYTSQGVLGSNNGSSAFVDTDFPLFRYADVLLMYAECVWRGGSGGSEAQALEYINNLRARANAPLLATNATLTEDLIFNERSMELFWEAHRRQDLRRFGRYTGAAYLWDWKGSVLNGTSIATTREIFPIHTQNLSANPNLQQNPGY